MQNEIANTNRVLYLDYLRVIATAGVMLIHVSAQNYYNVSVYSFEYLTFHFFDCAVQWTVPVFTMISGALFLNGTQTIKTIYCKNILRLLSAFVFWSIIYACISLADDRSVKGFISNILTGHYHMWYLLMLIGLYMMIPFLRVIVKDTILTKFFLILGIVFTFIFPEIIGIVTLVSESTGRFFNRILGMMQVTFTLGNTVYFVLGFYLNKINRELRNKWLIFLGIVGFFIPFFATIGVSYYEGDANTFFYDYFSIGVLLQSIFIFLLCKNKMKRPKSLKWVQCVSLLSKWSFGAYLVHALVLDVLDRFFGLNSLSFNPIVTVPILWAIVFLTSFFLSALINRIPFLNRFIV